MDTAPHRGSGTSSPEREWTALQRSADRGDVEAQFSLGVYYSSTLGEAFDFAEAARWYRKAAEQDHALAQFNLGVMLARGQGIPQDEAEAEDWMRKAGELGDAGGQHSLGLRCARAGLDPLSETGSDSRIEAYKWLHLAASQGYRGSHAACRGVTLSMSAAELEEGNARVGAFVVRETNPQAPGGKETG